MKKRRLFCLVVGALIFLTGCQGEEEVKKVEKPKDIVVDSGEELTETQKISNEYIEITSYKGVKSEEGGSTEITEEDVEQKITSILESNKVLRNINGRPAEKGDVATIDLSWESFGQLWSKNNFELELCSGELGEEIENAIVGHNIGETFQVKGVLPDYFDGAVDKEVFLTIKLMKLEEAEVPELNDSFVQSVSEKSKTVEEYKEEIKEILKEEHNIADNLVNRTEIWQQVLSNTNVKEYPEERIKEEREIYLMQSGMTEEDLVLEGDLDKIVEEKVKENLTVELIAETEKLYPSEDQLEKLKLQYISEYGFETPEEMEEMIGEGELDKLILLNIVQDWVFKHSL